jgi:hypothetical protein
MALSNLIDGLPTRKMYHLRNRNGGKFHLMLPDSPTKLHSVTSELNLTSVKTLNFSIIGQELERELPFCICEGNQSASLDAK